MKTFWPEINATKPQRPIHDKAILWATQDKCGNLPNGDSNCFPSEMGAIVARKHADQPHPLAAFCEAVSQAQERVWVIDKFFLEPEENKGNRQQRIEQILSWIPDGILANDFKFLTKSHNTNGNKEVDKNLARQFQDYAEYISKFRQRGANQFVIEVRFTLMQNFNYVHDRFAIIDDELWHFGATVGGFYSLVSAATRGWRASDHGAEQFFKLAWDAKSQMGKSQK
ncbi:hypothetical protein [Acidithiobacillus sp.]|uniref:hypothetical protein n=1 Tax=Acidithiobacillus sp. TaxID=1872118 RepID=UPI003D089835